MLVTESTQWPRYRVCSTCAMDLVNKMEIDNFQLVDSIRKITELAVFTLNTLIISCAKEKEGSNTY